jgi:type I restriction enzyme S subunit
MSEIEEINRILDFAIGSVFLQEHNLDHRISQSTAQRKNILKAAFSGQLVPQDPNDEPASALLARIRAQREANADAPARKRGRKAKGAA